MYRQINVNLFRLLFSYLVVIILSLDHDLMYSCHFYDDYKFFIEILFIFGKKFKFIKNEMYSSAHY